MATPHFDRRPLRTLAVATTLTALAGGFAGCSTLIPQQGQSSPGAPAPLAPGSPATAPATRGPAPAGGGSNPDWTRVAKDVAPDTVSIQISNQSQAGGGSGIILDREGHVLTNNHVATALGANAKITVTLTNDLSYPATIVGTDASTDLAVIKIPTVPQEATPAELGDSDQLAIGMPVMAIGAPLGLDNTVTTGIVSALHRPVVTQQEGGQSPAPDWDPFGRQRQQSQSEANTTYTSAIQTDAAINPGNSGGALVNANGQVIGINSSIASSGNGQNAGNIGLGFAIPINLAKKVSEQLIGTGRASHSVLGVSVKAGQVKIGEGTASGSQVSEVIGGGAAEKAGLKSGDVITQMDQVTLDSPTALTSYVRSQPVGGQHQVTYYRGQEKLTAQVTLQPS